MPLDPLDVRLLNLLQDNNQLTYAELAERANASASVCRRRIMALRRAKVISADVSIVDPSKVGQNLLVVTLVSLERDTADAHQLFRRRMREERQVVQCLFVTGGADYVIHICTVSVEAYEALAERLFTNDPIVKRFETMIVLNRVKSTSYVPIEPQTAASGEPA